MADHFQYPPDLFELLVETIPRLFRSKKSVLQFFQGAGVQGEDLAEVTQLVRTATSTTSKYEIVRTVLTRLNARGDSGLRARREVIKRVTEFENFDLCWETDRMVAKGLVSSVREAVQKKDAFTRMKQERDAEREVTQARYREAQSAFTDRRQSLEDVQRRLFALFAMDDQPHERGLLLESVLNDLFKAYGILIKESFVRRRPTDNSVVLEQIDGVIELGNTIHLVEMKWLNKPVGVAEFSPHLVRVMGRVGASGIFISSSGFTQPVIAQCTEFLNASTTVLCSLQEIVMLLQRQGDLIGFLKAKSQAAIVNKLPFFEILN